MKTSSIEVVNKAYESLQESQGFKGPKANACRKSNLEPVIHVVSEMIGMLAVVKKHSSVHSPVTDEEIRAQVAQLELSTTLETVGKFAGFEEQIKTFKEERGTALRYVSEMVMKIANKQKTIKELGHVGEVHVRMRIRLKNLRAQFTVEQLERL